METDVEPTRWIDERLHRRSQPPVVGSIVPSGFQAYARVLHPARRLFERSIERSVPLRWAEIAAARGKTMHPEVSLAALIDNADHEDERYWRAISTGGGEWSPPYEDLEVAEAVTLTQVLRPFTASEDAWFMRWDGYGVDGFGADVPRGMIHQVPAPPDVPAELRGRTWAYRHYVVLRGPFDAMGAWFTWRSEGPNYFWPEDRAWIVVTEIDGFSTYIGGTADCIEAVLASPALEALPSELTHRFDGLGDPINDSGPDGPMIDTP